MLLSYFGEKGTKKCHSCSSCAKKSVSDKDLILTLKTLLSREESISLGQLMLQTTYSKEQLVKALDSMVKEEVIEQKQGKNLNYSYYVHVHALFLIMCISFLPLF
mgnify:CR=1 FL=1